MFDVPFMCNKMTSICFIKDILENAELKELKNTITDKIDQEKLKLHGEPAWNDRWQDRCILLSTKYTKEQTEGNSVDLKNQAASNFRMAC